jgi:hypothetical protein
MHRASLERIVLCNGLVILAISVITWALPARAAEEGAAPPATAAKERQARQPAARLPNYYREIVTEEQREKILAIQRQYAAKIDPLRRELEKLTQERNEKIESLLTPEQRKQLAEIRAAAKAKRDAKSSAKSGKSTRPSRAPGPGKKAPEAAPAK